MARSPCRGAPDTHYLVHSWKTATHERQSVGLRCGRWRRWRERAAKKPARRESRTSRQGSLCPRRHRLSSPASPAGSTHSPSAVASTDHRGYNQNLGRLFVVCREHRPDDPPDIVGRIVRNRDAHTYQARAACLGSRYVYDCWVRTLRQRDRLQRAGVHIALHRGDLRDTLCLLPLPELGFLANGTADGCRRSQRRRIQQCQMDLNTDS